MKCRIEAEEVTTITRETWIDAPTEADARRIADHQDWRTWSVINQTIDTGIVMVEPVDSDIKARI